MEATIVNDTISNPPALIDGNVTSTGGALPTSSWFKPRSAEIESGDLILLVMTDHKRYLITVQPHAQLHTHEGIYKHDDMLGQPPGATVLSQTGHPALVMEPSLSDLIGHLKRGTQIIYPKDAAYLVHRMSLRAGSRIIEAGTGSGGLTTALAWAVAPTGIVYTYEMRADNFLLARNNLERVGLLPYVQMFHGSIADGFQQSWVDALFLDVREPWRFLEQAHAALRPSGFFASLVPTTNQVSELLSVLEKQGFADINVEELLLRRYKPVPDRLRPEDTMTAHTGYLIFARAIAPTVDATRWHAQERQRYRARQKNEVAMAAEAERRATDRDNGGLKYPPMPLPD